MRMDEESDFQGDAIVADNDDVAYEATPFSLAFFSEKGCPDCEEVRDWLTVLGSTFPELEVLEFEISKVSSKNLNSDLSNYFGVGVKTP